MDSLAHQIREIRRTLGEKQADFAARFAVDQSTVSKWERGTQKPEARHMEVLASLVPDEDGPAPADAALSSLFNLVPVAGYVGAGAVIHLVGGDTSSAGMGYIKSPKGFGAVEALVVRGDSMYPAYKDGDVIFYSGRPAELPIRAADEYVVRLRNDQLLLKVVEPGNDGRYTLAAYNAPPIREAEIVEAFKVRYVKKK